MPVPLVDSEVPIVVKKGETMTVGFDGFLLQAGTMLECYRECADRVVNGEQ